MRRMCRGYEFFVDVTEYDSICSQLQLSNRRFMSWMLYLRLPMTVFTLRIGMAVLHGLIRLGKRFAAFPAKKCLAGPRMIWWKTSGMINRRRWRHWSRRKLSRYWSIFWLDRVGKPGMATGTPMFDDKGNLQQIVVNVRI